MFLKCIIILIGAKTLWHIQLKKNFIKNCFARFNQKILNSKNILEVGSQDINGSVKDYFPIKPQNLGWIRYW